MSIYDTIIKLLFNLNEPDFNILFSNTYFYKNLIYWEHNRNPTNFKFSTVVNQKDKIIWYPYSKNTCIRFQHNTFLFGGLDIITTIIEYSNLKSILKLFSINNSSPTWEERIEQILFRYI